MTDYIEPWRVPGQEEPSLVRWDDKDDFDYTVHRKHTGNLTAEVVVPWHDVQGAWCVSSNRKVIKFSYVGRYTADHYDNMDYMKTKAREFGEKFKAFKAEVMK